MRPSEVDRQALSTLVTGAYVCPACAIVDWHLDRMTVDYPCPTCGSPSTGARSYFPIQAHGLVDLMQLILHSPSKPKSPLVVRQDIGVVVFFCTFLDVLLEHFLRVLMTAMDLSGAVQDRMLHDNRYHGQRLDRVFPALLDSKFSAAVADLGSASGHDWQPTLDFCKRAILARNSLIHGGQTWSVESTMPRECVDQSQEVSSLFVALHNRYVRPLYSAKGAPYCEPI